MKSEHLEGDIVKPMFSSLFCLSHFGAFWRTKLKTMELLTGGSSVPEGKQGRSRASWQKPNIFSAPHAVKNKTDTKLKWYKSEDMSVCVLPLVKAGQTGVSLCYERKTNKLL